MFTYSLSGRTRNCPLEGYAKDSGRDSEIFFAFDDKAGHNFISRGGNFIIDLQTYFYWN